MFSKRLLAAILVLALATIACGININLPSTDIKTGPLVTEDIQDAMPDSSEEVVDLTLSFGAGEIKLSGGEDDYLVSGKATYNVEDFKPVLKTDGNKVTLEQGNLNIKGIPNFQDKIKNVWDLALRDTPMNLSIKAGAYSGRFDLGGISLKSLEISDGASDVNLSFDEPNPVEMDVLRYSTGASSVRLEGLANANAATIIFRGGAGSYTLDFNGELQRDAVVSVEAGISSLVIVVPEGTTAKVTVEGGMSNIDAFGDWEKSGDAYSQAGGDYKLTILVKMGAGSVELRNK
jgi:hypothetical protein